MRVDLLKRLFYDTTPKNPTPYLFNPDRLTTPWAFIRTFIHVIKKRYNVYNTFTKGYDKLLIINHH
jgi:hypothetical protein